MRNQNLLAPFYNPMLIYKLTLNSSFIFHLWLGKEKEMPKTSHMDLHDTDSEDLGLLDSVSLPSEPPDIRNWFSSYVYESPELDKSDSFEGLDGTKETLIKEEITRKSGNYLPVIENECAGKVKSSSYTSELNESDDSECCKYAAMDSGWPESLSFPSEPPHIRNWFSSYVYESQPLDTAHDFGISVCGETEDGKLYVEEKSGSRKPKDTKASSSVKRIELDTLKSSSEAVVECPNMVEGTKLEYQSACEDEDDLNLQPLPSIPSPSSSDKIPDPILSRQEAGNNNHESLEKIGSINAHGNDYDAMLHSTFSSRIDPISLNMENNIGKGDSRRSMGKENEESELLEDGFISVRKKSLKENRENVVWLRNGVEPVMNEEKDTNVVKKVLYDISNLHSQNIQGSRGKWSNPRKNKPDLGPPLKQLRLDQWVRRA